MHLPKSPTHAGTTCGKALQVQTLRRAKRHSPPLQVLRTVTTARICRTQRLRLAHVRKYTRWKPFQCHRFMRACGSMALFSSLPRDQCGSLRTFPCGLLRGTPKTASRREESVIIHRQRRASSIALFLSISVSSSRLADEQELEEEVSRDLADGWLHQRPLPVVVAPCYLLCCVAVFMSRWKGVRVCACNVCTPHSMGGYIYCTVAVQFGG